MTNAIKVVLTVLAMSVVGLGAGLGLHAALMPRLEAGSFTRWQARGAPPEPAVQLLGLGSDRVPEAVFVAAASGQVYRCCGPGRPAWVAVEPPASYHSQPACDALPARAPLPPGTVVACAEAFAVEYVHERTQYALLADGTVWRWFYHVGLDTTLYLVGGGLLAGSLVGLVLAAIWSQTWSID
jgi:hypothetical protein